MQIENDEYIDEILKNWKGIIMLYRQFEERNPVLLLEDNEKKEFRSYIFTKGKKLGKKKIENKFKAVVLQRMVRDD